MDTNTKDEFIAAIEIGSSKITSMVGVRYADGSIRVQAFAQDSSSAFIRRGAVYNVDQTTECLKNMKKRLEDAVKRTISKVYVCIGGQSLHSALNPVVREFDVETKITNEMVDSLQEEDRQNDVGEYKLMKIIPQDYLIGKLRQASKSDVAGVVSDRIEGRFLNIYYKRRFYDLIRDCLAKAGFRNVEFRMTPIVLGDSLLNDDAKRTGCVLIDFGQDTTSVAIYSSRLLRRLTVIPIGSGNITKDIASVFKIEEAEAENLKTHYGSAFSEKEPDTDAPEKVYALHDGRDIKASELNDIIEARMEEILVNVDEQIKRSGLKAGDDLISGAVITGGGANLGNIERAIKQFTSIGDKVRFAKTVSSTVASKPEMRKALSGTLNATLSLLAIEKADCAGTAIGEPSIFGEAKDEPTPVENGQAEKPQDPEKPEKPKEPKKPGKLKRFLKKAKENIDKFVSPEE